MSPEFNYYKNTGLFIIIESLYNRDAMMSSVGPVGPSLVQVHKSVYELKIKQDLYLEEKNITNSNVSLWQRFRILTGARIISRDSLSKKQVFNLEYSGSCFSAALMAGSDERLPKYFGKEYHFSAPLAYGKDPVPMVKLYGAPNVRFIMPKGGKGAPEAAAKYNIKTGQIQLIESESELRSVIDELRLNQGR